jgi:hypothetical protein
MRKCFALMAIVLAVSATACNKDNSKLPLSPSTPTAAGSGGVGGSAAIAGTVVGGTSGASVQPAGSGLEVTIVGTSMSATVGSSGRFTFQNVPSGDVALQFTGSGVNARIMISGVADREQIRITINVNGNSATLDDNERETPDNRAKVEGRIVSVNCAANAATLVVGRTSQITVLVPAGTPIRHDGTAITCSQLLVGALVEVKGTKNGSSVTASEVELEDNPGPNQGPNPPPPGVSQVKLEGTISSAITGACPAISFTLGSRSVTTNASTKFDDTACTALKQGDRVEVEGTSQASGSVLATKVEKEDDDDDDDEDEDENEVEVRGAISSAVTGTCPSIGFSIGSTSVSTNASTRFDDTSCSALKRGDTVETKGTRQTNGSVLASRVKMKK